MLIDKYQLLQKVRRFDESLNHKPFKIYSKLTGTDIFHINLDISGECNLFCNMCSLARWYPKGTSKTVGMETIDELTEVIGKLKSISLICNTEPLLNKNLFEIVKRIRAANPSILITFTTNATLLTPEIATQILDHDIDKVGVSIDAVTPALFENIRVGAKFDEVLDNVKELIRQKAQRAGNGPKIEIIFVAMKKNIHELVPVIEMGAELGVQSVVVNGLEPYSRAMIEQVLYARDVDPEYIQIFADAKLRASELGLQLTLPQLKLEGFETCNLAHCVIDPDGEVLPCGPLSYERPYFFEGKKLVHPRKSFGNVNDRSFFEIWNSPDYRDFRERLRNGDLPEYCKTCLMKNEVICPN